MHIRCDDHEPNLGCPRFSVFVSGMGLTFPDATLLFGTRALQPLPLPVPLACTTSCQLLVHPVGAVAFRASRWGTASVFFPVPNVPDLVGSEFAFQAAKIDQGCVEVSNGLLVRIGRGPC